MSEDEITKIASLMSFSSKDFFTHSFKSIRTLNLFFSITNPLARGRTERFLITIVIDLESNLNNKLAQDLLQNFVMEFKNIKDIHTAFDLKAKNYKGNMDKFNELKNMFLSFYKNIKPTIEALEISESKLKERVKELTCLYELSKIFEIPDIKIEEILEKSVLLIVKALKDPEIACGRITYSGEEYKTDNFIITDYKISVSKKINGNSLSIELYYLEENSFLDEETLLIEDIANRLKTVIEKKRNEQNLIESVRTTTKIIEHMPIGILLINNEKRIRSANNKALEILGLRSEADILNEYCYNRIPYDISCEEIKRKKKDNFEVSIQDDMGNDIYLLVSVLPIVLGEDEYFLESFVDITQLKKVQNDLIRSEQTVKNRLRLEKNSLAISANFLTNSDIYDSFNNSLKVMGEFTNASKTLLYIFHNENTFTHYYDEWYNEGIPNTKLFHNTSPFRYPWLMQQLSMGDFVRINDVTIIEEIDKDLKDKFKAQNIKSILFFPIFIGTSLVGFTGYFNVNEIREWSYKDFMLLRSAVEIYRNAIVLKRSVILQEQFSDKLELEVKLRTKELKEAVENSNRISEELSKNSKFKTKLMEIVSYELRDSLNVIFGFNQLLQEQEIGNLNAKQLEYLKDIESASSSLLKIIDHLTEASMIDSKTITPKVE
ncbi:MAG: PAS domain-containing protein [Promethearchaeota archaeon]